MSAKHSTLDQLTETDIRRFWAKVDKNGPIPRHCPEIGACWVWIGGIQKSRGYGKLQVMGDRSAATGIGLAAHRVAYHLYVGPIPEGLNVLHHCDNPPCIRPAHLFKGTHVENVADRTAKGRSSKGSQVWRSVFTEGQVLGIRARLDAGERQSDIGREFGTSRHTIYCIHHRITWKHI